MRLAILCLLSLCPALHAATWYVSPAGSDAASGSIQHPWRTIQKAANSLAPGDKALVRSGTYNEAVTINVSGSAGSGLISFQAYPGESPIIDGTGLLPPAYQSALIHIVSRAYILISGFELRNYITSSKSAVPAGIYVEGTAHDIQLISNKVHAIQNDYNGVAANAFGIAIYGTSGTQPVSNILLQGNEVYKLKTGSSESVTFNGNVSGIEVLDNLVHDNDNIGIDFIGFEGTCPVAAYDQARNAICRGNTVWNIDTAGNPAYRSGSGYDPSADGIYVDGGAAVVIDRNNISTCDLGIEVASEHAGHYASHVIVRDNFIHNCYATGISTGGYSSTVGWAQDCAFTNNTLYQNDTLALGNGELEIQYKVTNCLFSQNILYAASPQDLLLSNPFTQNSGNTVDYNLYFTADGEAGSRWQWKNVTSTFAGYRMATGNDAHSIFADPQFITAGAAPNLHLRPSSPAIDAGNPAFVSGSDELDIDGNSRVINSRVEIGADELAPIERWRFAHFSAAQLSTPSIAGDLANPSGDGLSNLLDYALGFDPWERHASPIDTSLASGHLQLAFTRLRDATDITYHVQASADLSLWSDVWTSASVPYAGGTAATSTVTVDDSSAGLHRFIRLQVSHP